MHEGHGRPAHRSPARPSRTLLVAAAWLLLYAAATWSVRHSPSGRQLLGNVLFPLPLAVAVVLAARAARAVPVRRAFWSLVTAALVPLLAADAIWAVWHLQGRPTPRPPLPDALWALSCLLGLGAALLGLRGTSGARQHRAVLDAVVFAVGAGALTWRLLLQDLVPADGSVWSPVPLLYPMAQVATLVLVASVGVGGQRRLPGSVGLFLLAFLPAGVGDLGYVWVETHHGYLAGGWLDLAWQAQFVLLALAAAVAVEAGAAEPTVRLPDAHAGVVLMLTGAALALVLAAVDLADARSGRGGSFFGLVLVAAVFVAVVLRLALTVRDHRRVAHELDAALAEQRQLAVTDALTGLYNRRFFDEMLELETSRAHRQQTPLALLLIDLDRFKAVNDEHGHAAGDIVLTVVSQRLRLLLRRTDVLARHGGEEFVALLPGTGVDAAAEVAERARLAVRDAVVLEPRSGRAIAVTASIGVAGLPADATTGPDLLHGADRALYAAKAAGRNRVERVGSAVGGEPPSDPDPFRQLICEQSTGRSHRSERADREAQR